MEVWSIDRIRPDRVQEYDGGRYGGRKHGDLPLLAPTRPPLIENRCPSITSVVPKASLRRHRQPPRIRIMPICRHRSVRFVEYKQGQYIAWKNPDRDRRPPYSRRHRLQGPADRPHLQCAGGRATRARAFSAADDRSRPLGGDRQAWMWISKAYEATLSDRLETQTIAPELGDLRVRGPDHAIDKSFLVKTVFWAMPSGQWTDSGPPRILRHQLPAPMIRSEETDRR